ncbi:hypothetical protein [uncultured Dokdonia sp.]|uniref:hypothetical protein n=1 Tax=uncultured Dokdonia sp. TaxID=575653 RepID=UPI00260245D9|nr:hypothetical protein [uncultured Dokdonia sp.]
MSPKLKNLLTTAVLLVVTYASTAQEAVTGGPMPPPPPAPGRMGIPSLPGLAVPIDENILVLLVLGLLAGIVYFVRNRFSKA